MYSRSLKLFSILAIFLVIVQSSWIDRAIFMRQTDGTISTSGGGTGGGASTGSSSNSTKGGSTPLPAASSTTSPTPTSPPSKSNPPKSIPTNPVSVPQSSSPNLTPHTTAPQQNPTTTTTTSSTPPLANAHSTAYSLITITPSASQIVITVVATSSGIAYTREYTTSTTASAYATTTAVLTGDEPSSSSKSMSTKTKNTVIGVVVGIGGAILLGGLFIVAWRVWGRNKKGDDDGGLMGGYDPVSTGVEKTDVGPAQNRFQATLESYHQPGRGNVAANF